MEKEKSSPLTCLLMYHPDDRSVAEWLKKTVQRAGFTCYLLYEVAGADLHTEPFSCADDADCVILLVTQTLFDDEKCRKLHSKVYWHLGGEKYIVVRVAIEDRVFYSATGGFLEGCHVLRPEKMTDVEFRKCLVSEINAVACRIPIIPLSDNHFQPESDIESGVDNESLNIPASNNSDKGKFNLSQLSLGLSPAISEKFESTNQACANQFSSDVVASEERNASETSIPLILLNENVIVVASSSNSSRIPLSSEENCSKINHFVSFDQSLSSLLGPSVLENVKALPFNENSKTPQEKQILFGNTQVPESLHKKEDIRDQTSNAASSNKSYANLISDQTVSSEDGQRVQQSPPTSLVSTNNAYYSSSFEKKPERTYRYQSISEGSFLSMDDKTVSLAMTAKQLGDSPTSSSQLLNLGSFGKCTLHGKLKWKTVILEKPPNRFLRSPFVLPILNIEELQAGFRIATPVMRHGNLGQLLSSANGSIQMETECSSWKLYLLRIIYQISEAIGFLHDRNVFHGNITPNNILIDEQTNARLGDYGFRRDSGLNLPAHDACIAKDTDIFMFGITLWQILKCAEDRKFVEDELRTLTELPEAEAMAVDERSIEGKLWQLGSEETLHLCKILLQCLSKSHSKSHKSSMCDIKAYMKDHINLKLPLISFPLHNCIYCMAGLPKQGLQARSSNCPQECVFLNICPSCMPSVCSSCLSCPQHDSQIVPPFGGMNSCALLISGRDQNEQETQDTFYKDAFEIALCVAHPHIMAIPWGNIYHISPWENSTEDEINRVVHEIVTQKKPDFFLLYYSGHKATPGESSPLDVSDKQGDALNVAKLRHSLLRPLTETCSRLFIILDCCYAASLWPLLHQEQYSHDSHISFHTMWPSCGRKAMSNMPPNEEQSFFTKCVVTGLKGGRKCPNDTPSCQVCQNFRNEIDESHCISKKVLEEFVDMHMRGTFQEGRDDCQRPLILESRRDSDPVIAYYRNQALYRFHFESPKGQNFTRRTCEFDSLDYFVDEISQHLWNQLKDKYLPNQLDHLTLQIVRRESDDSVHELSEVSDIIKAVFEDADSLYVSIRTEGENLRDKKWVACFCDQAITEDAVRSLLNLKRNRPTIERGVKKISVNEVNPTWKPADDNVFDKTFQKCWNSFLSLKEQYQLRQGSDSFLQIEIREKLSMFSIATP